MFSPVKREIYFHFFAELSEVGFFEILRALLIHSILPVFEKKLFTFRPGSAPLRAASPVLLLFLNPSVQDEPVWSSVMEFCYQHSIAEAIPVT